MFDELVEERKYGEAMTLSDSLLRAAPTYFRAAELEVKRGDLLAGVLEQVPSAEVAYRRALALESTPFVREKALFGLGLCQERLGKVAEARSTWGHYLEEFPRGAHADEVLTHLDAWLRQ